jgi:hypothetical protein
MTHATQGQRIERVQQCLARAEAQGKTKAEQLPEIGSGEALTCPVIEIDVDDVVLNPNSHRIKAQLQDDPEWDRLREDPFSPEAQGLIKRLVREAREPEDFAELKSSLASDGQDHPGVITHDGVLVNANTRAVAIAEFEDPAKRFIRVAVLPETVKESQLTLLELRLQMRKELKVDYTLTNELLFIEELSERGVGNRRIGIELRVDPENPAKAEKEIETRLRLLDLVRELQRIPSRRLPLTVFDKLGYQQLRELSRTRSALMDTDPGEAQRQMECFVLSTVVGVTPVHSLRKIDASFMDTYMYEQLEENEELGRFAEQLALPAPEGSPAGNGGNPLSLPEEDGNGEGEVDLQRLIDAVTGPKKRMEIPGTDFTIERAAIGAGIKDAILTGIKEKDRVRRDENKLEAPISLVKAAADQLVEAKTAVKAVHRDSEFTRARRSSLEAAFKKLRKRQRELEKTLTDLEIVG